MLHQRETIKNIFLEKPNTWIPCFWFSEIALQYNARILELRRCGMDIRNRRKKLKTGAIQSEFMFIPATVPAERETVKQVFNGKGF